MNTLASGTTNAYEWQQTDNNAEHQVISNFYFHKYRTMMNLWIR